MSKFDERINREGLNSLRMSTSPANVVEKGVIGLWGAEFDFPTAPFVIEAISDWAKIGSICYTVDSVDYHNLIKYWMKLQRNWDIEQQWVVPVYGISSSLASCVRALSEEGDGIIGMNPGYHSYWKAVKLNNRHKVATELIYDGYQYSIDWQDLEAKMADPKNKMLVLCNPENPIGKVFSKEELLKIAQLAHKYDVIIYSDEIFAECIYDGVEMYSINQLTDLPVKLITATSLGKWLSFTGTNQANLIIDNEELRNKIIAQRDKEFYGSYDPMMLAAYKAAYSEDGKNWLKEMMSYVQENRKVVDEFYKTYLPKFKLTKTEGTFICWTDCTALGLTDKQIQEIFINKANIHVDHGTTYDAKDGFFRMNLTLPRADLIKGLNLLKDAFEEI